MRNIDAVITPSWFTETEIRKTYPEISTEIHPIHLGYDKTFFFKRPETEVNALKAKLKLPEKYILFVGTSDKEPGPGPKIHLGGSGGQNHPCFCEDTSNFTIRSLILSRPLFIKIPQIKIFIKTRFKT